MKKINQSSASNQHFGWSRKQFVQKFSIGSMANPSIFYNAENNAELLLKNTELMMSSCSSFIDFQKIEVIPTSRYRMIKDNKS